MWAERGLDQRPLGDRLGAHQPRAAARRGAERGEEDEPLARPARSAARTSRQVATPGELLDRAAGWSRITDARWTTVSTPRSAWRNDRGSDRSPSAIWTRTRSAPSRRGSRTRQRTGVPAAVSRLSSGRPMVPVAPVRSSTRREATGGRRRSVKCAVAPLTRKRQEEPKTYGLRDRRALHRHEGQLVRGGLPGRLHPSDARRAGLRRRRDALHRSGGVHRLRCLRGGLSGRRLLRRGPAPRGVAEVHPDQRGLLREPELYGPVAACGCSGPAHAPDSAGSPRSISCAAAD